MAQVNKGHGTGWSSGTYDNKWAAHSGLLAEQPGQAATGLLQEKVHKYMKTEKKICYYKSNPTKR